MSPDPVTIGGYIGSFAAAAFAAYTAYRAQRNSSNAERRTAVVQTEVMGPGDEPSLRSMVQDHHTTVIRELGSMHGGLLNLSDRLKGLESTVFTQHQDRISKLEQSGRDSALVTVTLQSMGEQLKTLAEDGFRNSLNIHNIANACHVRVFTREEAIEEQRRREAEEARAKT